MSAKISIMPDPVNQHEAVTIAIEILDKSDPSEWYMRILCARDSSTRLPARKLGAYGAPEAGLSDAYDCKIHTVGFEPGTYLVDLAHKGGFESSGMVSKAFTVVPV